MLLGGKPLRPLHDPLLDLQDHLQCSWQMSKRSQMTAFLLGGELVIESTPGAGTTVIVRIPGGGSEDRRQ